MNNPHLASIRTQNELCNVIAQLRQQLHESEFNAIKEREKATELQEKLSCRHHQEAELRVNLGRATADLEQSNAMLSRREAEIVALYETIRLNKTRIAALEGENVALKSKKARHAKR